MYARVATFESDPAKIDDAIAMVRGEVEAANTPPGLEGAKMLMLVEPRDRQGPRRDAVRERGGDAPRRRGAERDESRLDRAPDGGRVLRGAGPHRRLSGPATVRVVCSRPAVRPSGGRGRRTRTRPPCRTPRRTGSRGPVARASCFARSTRRSSVPSWTRSTTTLTAVTPRSSVAVSASRQRAAPVVSFVSQVTSSRRTRGRLRSGGGSGASTVMGWTLPVTMSGADAVPPALRAVATQKMPSSIQASRRRRVRRLWPGSA